MLPTTRVFTSTTANIKFMEGDITLELITRQQNLEPVEFKMITIIDGRGNRFPIYDEKSLRNLRVVVNDAASYLTGI